jgi:hypothetical protein
MDINYELILVYFAQLNNCTVKCIFISNPMTTMEYVLHKERHKENLFVTLFTYSYEREIKVPSIFRGNLVNRIALSEVSDCHKKLVWIILDLRLGPLVLMVIL